MTVQRRLHIALLTLPIVAIPVSTAPLAQGSIEPASESEQSQMLLERFLTQEVVPLTSSRAIRRLHAQNLRFKAEGWLEVETSLANRALEWKVMSEGGSAYIRNKVLRKALAAEAEMLAQGQGHRGALTPDNYELVPANAGRIALRPRREDALLIAGSALISQDGAELLEIRGRLTKNPSFWTRNVEVRRRYARVNGVRVPIAMVSTAQVRLAGPSEFEMTYRYLEVNGATIEGQPTAR
jgi:hypothetical protein